jgi:hypothetical protein
MVMLLGFNIGRGSSLVSSETLTVILMSGGEFSMASSRTTYGAVDVRQSKKENSQWRPPNLLIC